MRSVLGPIPVLTGALTRRQPHEDKRHAGTSYDHEGRYKPKGRRWETTQSQLQARQDSPVWSRSRGLPLGFSVQIVRPWISVVLKCNELLSHKKTWRNFNCILLSEIRQSEKATIPWIPTIWHSWKGKIMRER